MKTLIQRLALGYSFIFMAVVALNYVPSIHDAQGLMFGLFKLDFIDDVLHTGSAAWALIAGLCSAGAARFYFRWFGLAYLADGILGLAAGKGYLDLAIFKDGPAVADFMTRIALNVPHIVLGGTAALIGFVWLAGRQSRRR